MEMLLLIISIATFLAKPGHAFFQCRDVDPIPLSSIIASHTFSQLSDGSWSLTYTISWQPPTGYSPGEINYIAVLQIETSENSIVEKRFQSCQQALTESYTTALDQLTQSPTITQEAPFTHDGLFQVGYAVLTQISNIPVSAVAAVEIETPDCFEATGDERFCETQSVLRCGMPRYVNLEIVAYSPKHNISMTFSWYPPIQVNRMRRLVEYRVQLYSEDGDFLLADTVQHDGMQVYHWKATSPHIEEDNQYNLTVVPYVSSSGSNSEPGRLFTGMFTAELSTEVFTAELSTEEFTNQTLTTLPKTEATNVRVAQAGDDHTTKPKPSHGSTSYLTVIIILICVGLTTIIVIISIVWLVRRKRRANNDRVENLEI